MSGIPFQFSYDLNPHQRFLFHAKIGFVTQQFYHDKAVDTPAAQELYDVFTPLTRQDLILKRARLAERIAVHIDTDLKLDSVDAGSAMTDSELMPPPAPRVIQQPRA
jgi:hypothetical protein